MKAKSRARSKWYLITEEVKAERVERSMKLLSIFKKVQPIMLFSDEELFTVDPVSNSRTNRYISTSNPEDVPESIRFKFRTKHTVRRENERN